MPPEVLIVPDRWVIVQIMNVYKILSGFQGGYLTSDEWRLNSGIESIAEEKDKYIVTGYSGTTYHLRKDAEGFTMVSRSYYEDLIERYPNDIRRVDVQHVITALGE